MRVASSAVLALLGSLLLPGLASAATAPAAAPALGTGALVPLVGSSTPVPPGASVVGPTSPASTITVDVALRPRDPSGLAAFAAAVSTPGNPRYHRYLPAGHLAASFGPAAAVVRATRSWLASTGLAVGPTSGSGLLVPVTGTAAQLESAFAVPLVQARLSSGRVARLATRNPVVPSSLVPSLQGVVGLSDTALSAPHLAGRAPLAATPSTPSSPGSTPASTPSSLQPSDQTLSGPQACPAITGRNGAWTATQLASTYGLSRVYGGGRDGAGETVGIYELEPYTPSDIAAYEACYGLTVPVTTIDVDGGAGTSVQYGEAALDIEVVAGLAPGASIEVYTGPNNGANGPIDTYAKMVSDDTADVISTSWGSCEPQMTSAELQAEDTQFTMAATQGQTVLAASGDSGSSDCYAQTKGSDASLSVDDPAVQPEVTGVGGTSLTAAAANAPTEQVWDDPGDQAAGGGGDSTVFAAPAWQTDARTQVSGSSFSCGSVSPFNQQCREVPDVAASADPNEGDIAYFEGNWVRIGGTSAAAPLWAALVAVADQGCATPAGFLNDALYSTGASSDFHDITGVDNNLFGQTSMFPAGAGYDLASGWGSPRADLLLGLLTGAPSGCPAVTSLSPSAGPARGNTTVVVSGSGFGADPSVAFGGVAARVVSSSPSGTSITVVTPAVSPGTSDVTVTNGATTAGGTSATTSVAQFTFLAPQITSVTADRGPLSGGGTVTIAGSGFYGVQQVTFGGVTAPFTVASPGSITATVPARQQPGSVDVVVTATSGTSPTVPGDRYTYALPGYWLVATDGGIFNFGGAGFFGSAGGLSLSKPITSMAATPDDAGYWLAATDGGIFAYGDAGFYGSTGNFRLNQPIVGMAATPDGRGYWLVATDGGIFAFGDAGFYGSTGNLTLNKPIVGMAATPDGRGYWLVASDGGIFAFGDAGFHGSTGNLTLNQPIVGMAATPDGKGYWLVASDGGIFAFGDAGFHGSTGAITLNKPIVGMGVDLTGDGYWLVAADWGIFAFATAPYDGSTGGIALNRPITGMAAT